jgi:hypothetical protein
MSVKVLRVVNSQKLRCGCLIGIYETYDGNTVGLIDAHAVECSDREHRLNHLVPFGSITRTSKSTADTN